eukprot:252618-Prorocentrum_minimum.AAC.1
MGCFCPSRRCPDHVVGRSGWQLERAIALASDGPTGGRSVSAVCFSTFACIRQGVQEPCAP